MTKFEEAVTAEVKRIREILVKQETLSHFEFFIEASGRVHDGEVKIIFVLGEYSSSVKANSVNAAVAEYLRRKGFEERHAGLLLTSQAPADDEIPF